MIIIVTRDPHVVRWASSSESNAAAWGDLVIINAHDQVTATMQLYTALQQAAADEPVCLVGHGNDTEIGDAGEDPSDWTWSYEDIANLLAQALGSGYRGAILIQACADTVANFSAHTALWLQESRQLCKVWLYGYNRAVGVYRTLPDPGSLDKNVELQGTYVRC